MASRKHRLTASVAYMATLRAYVRVNLWPVGSPCLLFGQFVKN